MEAIPLGRLETKGLADIVEDLLTPSVCGFALSHADIARLSRETGVPLRLLDRRERLTGLFRHALEFGALDELFIVLARLAEEHARLYEKWAGLYPGSSSIWKWWSARAQETACQLERMRAQARELLPGLFGSETEVSPMTTVALDEGNPAGALHHDLGEPVEP